MDGWMRYECMYALVFFSPLDSQMVIIFRYSLPLHADRLFPRPLKEARERNLLRTLAEEYRRRQ